MNSVIQDIRFAIRSFRRSPGFTIAALAILALAIATNTAVFSIVHAVLLKPLPYPQADRLVMIRKSLPQREFLPSISPGQYYDFRQSARLFEDFGAMWGQRVAITEANDTQQVDSGLITASMFPMLGIRMAAGRAFAEEDHAINGPRIAILSHALWQSRFGGDPGLIGRAIRVDGQPATVVGVMPRDFRIWLPQDAGVTPTADLWTPIRANPDWRNSWMRVVARLREGVTLPQAQAEMDSIAARTNREQPVYEGTSERLHVIPLQSDVVRRIRPAVFALWIFVSLVLAIACANVANLCLTRAAGREREISIRSALGASGGRVIRQLITESALLGFTGGLIGILLASWSLSALLQLAPQSMPRREDIAIDPVVLLVSIAMSIGAGVVFGLVPAFSASRTDLVSALRESAGSAAGGWKTRFRRALVAAEVALSIVVLAGAGLLVKTLGRLQHSALGFAPAQVWISSIDIPFARYRNPGALSNAAQRIVTAVQSARGVDAAGAISFAPLGGRFQTGEYSTELDVTQQQTARACDQRTVTPGLFDALGTRFVAGRDFTWEDQTQSRAVAIVDAHLARSAWPNQNPTGQRIRYRVGTNLVWLEVIGVVEHVRFDNVAKDGREQVYLLPSSAATTTISVAMRTRLPREVALAELKDELRRIDPDLGASPMRSMESFVADAIAPARLATLLLSGFAAMAAVLAAIGLYAVISYSVTLRRREIAIRIALGANRRETIGMVLREGMLMAGMGMVAGAGGSFALRPLLAGVVEGTGALDVAALVAVLLFSLTVAIAACWVPALRAARTDPAVALRS